MDVLEEWSFNHEDSQKLDVLVKKAIEQLEQVQERAGDSAPTARGMHYLTTSLRTAAEVGHALVLASQGMDSLLHTLADQEENLRG